MFYADQPLVGRTNVRNTRAPLRIACGVKETKGLPLKCDIASAGRCKKTSWGPVRRRAAVESMISNSCGRVVQESFGDVSDEAA
jgi:hypothetical protein